VDCSNRKYAIRLQISIEEGESVKRPYVHERDKRLGETAASDGLDGRS